MEAVVTNMEERFVEGLQTPNKKDLVVETTNMRGAAIVSGWRPALGYTALGHPEGRA